MNKKLAEIRKKELAFLKKKDPEYIKNPRKNLSDKYKLFVISSGRANTFRSMKDVIKNEAAFVVGKGEENAYRDAGAKEVHVGGTLIESRNKALDLAFAENKYCIQIDDDLIDIKLNDFSGKNTNKIIDLGNYIDELVEFADSRTEKLIGIPPTSNPFYAKNEIQLNAFIIASLCLTKPSDERFDNNLRLKEDYDFTLQHIKNNGGVVRFHKYLISFKHYTNAGGAVSYRNNITETEAINYLIDKWGDAIRLNTKRENEILFRRNVKKYL